MTVIYVLDIAIASGLVLALALGAYIEVTDIIAKI